MKRINKIRELFNVRKYKRRINTLENKCQALSDEQIELLKADRSMLNDNAQLKEQVREQKKEIKELKRIIEEDYKSRIDKAIEMLKRYGNGTFDEELLNILEGNDKE